MSTRKSDKPLSGIDGYKRLARLFARALYNNEMPPREEDDAETAPKSKFKKHSFKGLGIVLIDYLAQHVDGYIDETSLASALRLSPKNVRKALLYLEGERLVTSEAIKLSFRRKNAETPDDIEVEERKRQETHVYWCFDFPRFVNWVRLKISKIGQLLQKHIGDGSDVLQYICPQCGAIYSSLNAISLLDPFSGSFKCEECKTELIEHIEHAGTKGLGLGVSAATRRERQEYYKTLQTRFEQQMLPIFDQLEKLKDTKPPDFGSLRDWSFDKREEQARRAQRLEAARQRAAAGGGLNTLEMTEEQLLEWAERADFAVALPGQEGAGAEGAGSVPGKALPAWFRNTAQEEDEGRVLSDSVGGVVEHAMNIQNDAEKQRTLLEQQYLQQYLSQVRQVQTAMAAGMSHHHVKKEEEKGGGEEKKEGQGGEEREAKRMKIGGVEGEQMVVVQKKEEDIGWVDAGNGMHGGGDEDVEWEDA